MKNIKVFNNNDKNVSIHEFDIFVSKTKNKEIKYDLKYSHMSDWTCPGELILTCIDTGNGFKYIFNQTYNFKSLEYNENYYIFIMLKYIMKKQKYNKFKYK